MQPVLPSSALAGLLAMEGRERKNERWRLELHVLVEKPWRRFARTWQAKRVETIVFDMLRFMPFSFFHMFRI